MGRVSSPDCLGSKRNSFLLAASLCHPSLAKVAGLGFVEGKRKGGGRLGFHRVGSHVVAVDPGVVAEQAGGQGLQQGGVVRSAGPHVESGDVGVAAHGLNNEV